MRLTNRRLIHIIHLLRDDIDNAEMLGLAR